MSTSVSFTQQVVLYSVRLEDLPVVDTEIVSGEDNGVLEVEATAGSGRALMDGSGFL